MKKLDKDTVFRIGVLSAELERLRAKVEDAFRAMQEADPLAELNAAIAAYNEKATEANGVAEDVASQIEAYIDGKSDTWRDSERGEAYASWLQEWQGIEFEEMLSVSLDIPDPSEVDTSLLDEAPTVLVEG